MTSNILEMMRHSCTFTM